MNIGDRYDRLTLVRIVRRARSRNWWLCACVCGVEVVICQTSLQRAKPHSCRKCRHIKHGATSGGSGSPTWQSWRAMRRRCYDTKFVSYRFYGAIGVRVCAEWNDSRTGFRKFLSDMGERPDGMTLDRRDPYGNYEKSNCKWSANPEQQKNKRRMYYYIGQAEGDLREQAHWDEEETRHPAEHVNDNDDGVTE